MPDKIRAFVALPLPNEVKKELGQVSRQLADQLPPGTVRWVAPDRMHLTLRFLGETAVPLIPKIAAGMDLVGRRKAPFSLHLDNLGSFPHKKRPRVLWVGLAGDLMQLSDLKRGIDQVLAPLGWELERRPFQPHLTLGRVKDSRKIKGHHWYCEVKEVEMRITAVHLIESRLKPAGAEYLNRHVSPLEIK